MKVREIFLAAAVVHLALYGLNFGEPQPEIAIGIGSGEPAPAALAEGSECVLVVFLDPECPRCSDVYAQARQATPSAVPDHELFWIMPEDERGRSHPGAFADVTGITYADSLFSLFQVRAVPSAVLIRHNEVVASGGIPARTDVRSLTERCVSPPADAPWVATEASGQAGRPGLLTARDPDSDRRLRDGV